MDHLACLCEQTELPACSIIVEYSVHALSPLVARLPMYVVYNKKVNVMFAASMYCISTHTDTRADRHGHTDTHRDRHAYTHAHTQTHSHMHTHTHTHVWHRVITTKGVQDAGQLLYHFQQQLVHEVQVDTGGHKPCVMSHYYSPSLSSKSYETLSMSYETFCGPC